MPRLSRKRNLRGKRKSLRKNKSRRNKKRISKRKMRGGQGGPVPTYGENLMKQFKISGIYGDNDESQRQWATVAQQPLWGGPSDGTTGYRVVGQGRSGPVLEATQTSLLKR